MISFFLLKIDRKTIRSVDSIFILDYLLNVFANKLWKDVEQKTKNKETFSKFLEGCKLKKIKEVEKKILINFSFLMRLRDYKYFYLDQTWSNASQKKI